jgi:hypothetical protein
LPTAANLSATQQLRQSVEPQNPVNFAAIMPQKNARFSMVIRNVFQRKMRAKKTMEQFARQLTRSLVVKMEGRYAFLIRKATQDAWI